MGICWDMLLISRRRSLLHVDLLLISNARGISSGDQGGHGVTGFGNNGDYD
jgi:hypothetical protein